MKRRPKKPNQSKISAKSAFSTLTSTILARTLPDELYNQEVARFLHWEPIKTFSRHLQVLLGDDRFRKCFNFPIVRFEDIRPLRFSRSLGEDRFWVLTLTVFRVNSSRLTLFASLRDQVEQALFLGKWDVAESNLDKVDSEFGESLWGLSCRGILLYERGDHSRFRALAEGIKSRLPFRHHHYLVNVLQILCESEELQQPIRTLVLSPIKEFCTGGALELADLLALTFLQQPLAGQASIEHSGTALELYPLIDQYNLATKLWTMEVASSALEDNNSPPAMARARELSSVVKDRILDSLAGGYARTPRRTKLGEELLRDYEAGNYSSVTNRFLANYTELENPLAYLNLVAKGEAFDSAINSRSRADLGPYITALRDLYLLGENSGPAQERVTAAVLKSSLLLNGMHLQLALYKAIPNSFTKEEIEKSARLSAAISREVTPLSGDLVRMNAFGGGSSMYESPLSPDYRLSKREIYRLLAQGAKTDALVAQLDDFSAKNPLFKDYVELYTLVATERDLWGDLVDKASRWLAQSISVLSCLPTDSVIDAIDTHRLHSIEAVVTAFYCTRYRRHDQDFVLNEAFEDYIRATGSTRPSELLDKPKELTIIDDIFFKDVCTLDTLDCLGCFRTVSQLRSERVRILDLLLHDGRISSDFRMAEVEQLVWQGVVEAAAVRINGAKLAVDEVSIKKNVAEEIDVLIDLFKRSALADDRFIELSSATPETTGSIVFLGGERNNAALKIWKTYALAFLTDEKFGLDKVLSAEIRHGFFSNLMRSRAEEARTVMEVDDEGRYAPAGYWRDKMPFIVEELWVRIDQVFGSFSAALTQLIEKAEEWMKIEMNGVHSERMFRFEINVGVGEFEALKAVIDSSESSESVINFMSESLWQQTESCATRIRERLGGEFRAEVDTLFQNLESDLMEAKLSTGMADLMQAVSEARERVKDDISTIVEWFRRTEAVETTSYSLAQVIEISLRAFEEIKGGAFGIEHEPVLHLSDITVPPAMVKPFVLAMVNLLDNCYRHSGLYQETRVSIQTAKTPHGAQITIANSLHEEKVQVLTDSRLEEIQTQMASRDNPRAMLTEGGSGLSKAYQLMKSFSALSGISATKRGRLFEATIVYAN